MVIVAILKLSQDQSKKIKMYLLPVFHFNLVVITINTLPQRKLILNGK